MKVYIYESHIIWSKVLLSLTEIINFVGIAWFCPNYNMETFKKLVVGMYTLNSKYKLSNFHFGVISNLQKNSKNSLWISSIFIVFWHICLIGFPLYRYILIVLFSGSFEGRLHILFPYTLNTKTYSFTSKDILLYKHSTVIKFRKFNIDVILLSMNTIY